MLPITPPVTLNDINATARTISRIGNDPAMDLPTARDQIAALVARLLPDALAVSISKPGAADLAELCAHSGWGGVAVVSMGPTSPPRSTEISQTWRLCQKVGDPSGSS